jgi:hypothetical protein
MGTTCSIDACSDNKLDHTTDAPCHPCATCHLHSAGPLNSMHAHHCHQFQTIDGDVPSIPTNCPASSKAGIPSSIPFAAPEAVLVLEALPCIAPRSTEVRHAVSPPQVPTDFCDAEGMMNDDDGQDTESDEEDSGDEEFSTQEEGVPSWYYRRQDNSPSGLFSRSSSRSVSSRGLLAATAPLSALCVDHCNVSGGACGPGQSGGSGASRASLLLFPPTNSFGLEDCGTASPLRSILSCPGTPRVDSASTTQSMRVSFFSHAVVLTGCDGAAGGGVGGALAEQPSLEGCCEGAYMAPPALAAFLSPGSTIPYQIAHSPQTTPPLSLAPQISITSLRGVTLRRCCSSDSQLDSICDDLGVAAGTTSAALVPLLCPTTPQRRQLARRATTKPTSAAQISNGNANKRYSVI